MPSCCFIGVENDAFYIPYFPTSNPRFPPLFVALYNIKPFLATPLLTNIWGGQTKSYNIINYYLHVSSWIILTSRGAPKNFKRRGSKKIGEQLLKNKKWKNILTRIPRIRLRCSHTGIHFAERGAACDWTSNRERFCNSRRSYRDRNQQHSEFQR